MLRYEKLNKNFNRIWYHGMTNHHRALAHPTDSPRQSNQTPKHRHSSSREENSSFDSLEKGRSSTIVGESLSPSNSSYESENFDKNTRNVFENDNVLDDGKSPGDRHDDEYSERDRYERAAIVAFEKRNQASTTAMPSSKDEVNDDTNTWNESRTGRYRRDEGRGKKRRKIKRRLKRSRRRLGIDRFLFWYTWIMRFCFFFYFSLRNSLSLLSHHQYGRFNAVVKNSSSRLLHVNWYANVNFHLHDDWIEKIPIVVGSRDFPHY